MVDVLRRAHPADQYCILRVMSTFGTTVCPQTQTGKTEKLGCHLCPFILLANLDSTHIVFRLKAQPGKVCHLTAASCSLCIQSILRAGDGQHECSGWSSPLAGHRGAYSPLTPIPEQSALCCRVTGLLESRAGVCSLLQQVQRTTPPCVLHNACVI